MSLTPPRPLGTVREVIIRALAAALTVAALAACAGPRPAVTGSTAHTIDVDGTPRTYHLYRPAGLTAASPLVVVLHGGFGSGSQAESDYGWDRLADSAGFTIAYPDGLDRAWDVGGGCCGRPGTTRVDDVGFVEAVVADVPGVDPARVYATGISNGGMLAYRLACDTTLFAAIGPDSATQLGPCPSPGPVSVIHIHGTADHNLPYDGSPGQGVAHIDGPPIPDVVASWRAVDGCPAPTSATAGVVTTSVAACPSGRAVELVTIDGAGHQWPGSAPKRLGGVLGLDPPSTALDATAVIWAFFSAHPKDG